MPKSKKAVAPGALVHSSDRRIRHTTAYGALAFIFVLVGVGVALFVVTGGAFLPAHWAAFYIIVALICGIAFWAFTGATGEFVWKEFGWKLGGGAAIGIIFMLAAKKITPDPPPNIRLIDVRVAGLGNTRELDHNGNINRVVQLPGSDRYIVEFAEGAMSGEVYVNYLKGQERRQKAYTVPRVGKLPEPEDKLQKD